MKKFIITQQWPGYDLLDKAPEGKSYAILESYLIRPNKDGFCFFKDHKTGLRFTLMPYSDHAPRDRSIDFSKYGWGGLFRLVTQRDASGKLIWESAQKILFTGGEYRGILKWR